MSKYLIDWIEQYHILDDAWEGMKKQNESLMKMQDSLKYLEKDHFDYSILIQTIKEQFEDTSKILQGAVNNTLARKEEDGLLKNISGNIEEFKGKFKTFKSSYQEYMTSMITHLDDKIYIMKTSNLTQRMMILDIFHEYCDALFYQTFANCHHFNIDLSSNFLTILEELRKLQWQISTFKSKLPQSPSKFASHKAIIGNDFYPHPIQRLKENK